MLYNNLWGWAIDRIRAIDFLDIQNYPKSNYTTAQQTRVLAKV
ncbi:hypothetical protein [Microcoleus sp. herbarium12]